MSEMTSLQRREYSKTAKRKQEIIDAAVQVFSEFGYRKGTLRDVAERAGLTHAGIRHHFPSKLDLLQAVLAWRDEEALELGSLAHPKGMGVLEEWLSAVRQIPNSPALVEMQIMLAAEATSPGHPAHEYFRNRYVKAVKILTRAFTQIQEAGQLQPHVNAREAAELVVAANEGLQLMWFYDHSTDIAGRLKQVIDSLLKPQ